MTTRSLSVWSVALAVVLIIGGLFYLIPEDSTPQPVDAAAAAADLSTANGGGNGQTDSPLNAAQSPPESVAPQPPGPVESGTGVPDKSAPPRDPLVPDVRDFPREQVIRPPIGNEPGLSVGWSTPDGQPKAPALPPEPAPGGPCTALPNWNTTKGEVIRAEKRNAGDHARDFAYPSNAVDVHRPGEYTLDFGPLDPGRYENFPPPVSRVHPPEAIGIMLPDDFNSRVLFDMASTPPPTTVFKDGARYLRVVVTIKTGLDKRPVRPCTGLVAWLA